MVSKRAQRLGRWEIRAKIPTSRNIWSTIRLLPQPSAPGPYTIDIMENHGHRPTVTASACHWGPRTPSSQNELVIEQQTSLAGKLVSYPDGFHVYAVEWLDDQLRFYVDDVYHAILYSDEVGGFFSRQTAPMQLAIGTAIANAPSDDSTIWPQRFLVDWVRVYEPSDRPAVHKFSNGSFEANGGTLAGWHVFGSRINGEPNVLAHREAVKDGNASLKLFGQHSGGGSYSGVSQGISVSGGHSVRAKLSVMVRSSDGIARTDNRATMKIEFYNRFGDYFGGPAMLGFEERVDRRWIDAQRRVERARACRHRRRAAPSKHGYRSCSRSRPMNPAPCISTAWNSRGLRINRYAMISCTTRAGLTPVSFSSSPRNEYVSRAWSRPSRCSSVAWKSRTWTASLIGA